MGESITNSKKLSLGNLARTFLIFLSRRERIGGPPILHVLNVTFNHSVNLGGGVIIYEIFKSPPTPNSSNPAKKLFNSLILKVMICSSANFEVLMFRRFFAN